MKFLLKYLARIRILLNGNLPGVKIIDGLELLCDAGYNLERGGMAARSAWISDPVRPSAQCLCSEWHGGEEHQQLGP